MARAPAGRALLVAFFAATLAAVGVWRLDPDPSLEAMFSENDPAAAAMSRCLNDFSAADELLVLASIPGDTGPADPERRPAFARRFEQAVRDSPAASVLVLRVAHRADPDARQFIQDVLVPNGLYYLDGVAFAAAQERLTRAGMAAQIRRNEAMIAAPGPAIGALSKALLRDPLHLNEFALERLAAGRALKTYGGGDAFISPDGRGLLVRVAGRRSTNDLEFCQAITARIAALVEEMDRDGLRVEYCGGYAIAAERGRSIRHDLISSTVGSVVCLIGLFVVFYRNPLRLSRLAPGPVGLGVFLGFGATALTPIRLTPMTAAIGAILAGMGIDYSIQYLSCYERHRVRVGAGGGGRTDRGRHRRRPVRRVGHFDHRLPGHRIFHRPAPAGLRATGHAGPNRLLRVAVFVLPALVALTHRRGGGGGGGGGGAGPVRSRLRFDLGPCCWPWAARAAVGGAFAGDISGGRGRPGGVRVVAGVGAGFDRDAPATQPAVGVR